MMDALSLGALDLETNIYMSPTDANKTKQYKCIDCNQKVILRKGTIRRPHFAHYSPTNTCSYYEHPNESQIHKDAKMLMAKLLREQKRIQFTWDCHHCKTESDSYAFNSIPSIIYKEGDEVVTEYRDKTGKWIADVAIINGGEVRYIIEIKNTHATTTTCRPEPWYEIEAKDLIEYINNDNGFMDPVIGDIRLEPEFMYTFPCVRQGLQRYCYGSFCYKESWVKRIPGYDASTTDRCCILCKAEEYEPISDGSTGKFQKEEIRVCAPCLLKDSYEKALRTMYIPVSKANIVVTPDTSGCNGYGYCWQQNNVGRLIQKTCLYNCKLWPCKGINCGAMEPQYQLNIHNNMCCDCAVMYYSNLYLEVPYARKDEAKAMGAKWDFTKKKWYISKDTKNLKDVLARFKQTLK